jgi:hypothetical protein
VLSATDSGQYATRTVNAVRTTTCREEKRRGDGMIKPRDSREIQSPELLRERERERA